MMFPCMECGRLYAQITGKHVKKHGYSTVAEYLEKYPGAQTVEARKDSPETIAKKRIARTGKKHSEEAKAKIGAGNRGKKMSGEAIDKWRVSYRKYLDEHGSPMLGKDRGDAFRKKMSEIAKARPKEMVDAKVAMMLEARRGSKATLEQRERYSAGRIKYMLENPDKLPRKLFDTVPELEFEAELTNRNINFERSVHLGNRVYDFKIGSNVLVEIDGPYHHRLGMYIRTDASDEDKVEKLMNTIQRDRGKDKKARDLGYFIYRIPVGQHLPKDWYDILLEQGFTEF